MEIRFEIIIKGVDPKLGLQQYIPIMDKKGKPDELDTFSVLHGQKK